jgi:hypothetical protein
MEAYGGTQGGLLYPQRSLSGFILFLSTKPSISVGALLGKSRVGCGMSPETVKQLCMTKARKLKEKYQDTGDWRI